MNWEKRSLIDELNDHCLHKTSMDFTAWTRTDIHLSPIHVEMDQYRNYCKISTDEKQRELCLNCRQILHRFQNWRRFIDSYDDLTQTIRSLQDKVSELETKLSKN